MDLPVSYNPPRFVLHSNMHICAVWIFYHLKQEMRHFVITRQQHLIERTHWKSVQANTILITGIPAKYLTQDALFKLYNNLPGGVKKIWINRFVLFVFILDAFQHPSALETPSIDALTTVI
jgi:hypothetical protein